MRWIGPIGWIRRWIGRHWCRDLGDLREQVQRAANARILLQSQAEQIQNLLATIRELTEHNVHSLAEMADAHKKLLAEDLGCDLARIITTVGLVACRLDALAERMGLGAGAAGPPDGGEVDQTGESACRDRERIKPPE